jgi:hypothetical protein
VGVEVFSGGARIVKLSSRRGKLELADFGEKGLEHGLSAFDRVADGFGRLLNGARVCVSFPGQTSQTYRLRAAAELFANSPDLLKWELTQKLPSKNEEYEYSFQPGGWGGVLGTAARRKVVEQIAVPFVKKGAADLSFSSAGFGLAALLFASGQPVEGSAALVNLGEDFVTVAVVDKGELTYVSEIPSPPGYLDSSDGDLAQTRELLQKSLMERFGVELSTLLHLLGFRATEAGKIDLVYLTGPGAGAGSLASAIGALGGTRVGHLTTPLVQFPSDENALRWAVPLGLALAGLSEKMTPRAAAEFFFP